MFLLASFKYLLLLIYSYLEILRDLRRSGHYPNVNYVTDRVHLQSISQQGSLLLFIILSNIFHQIYPTLHKQKSPRKLVQYRQLFRSAPGGAVFSIRTTALGINI